MKLKYWLLCVSGQEFQNKYIIKTFLKLSKNNTSSNVPGAATEVNVKNQELLQDRQKSGSHTIDWHKFKAEKKTKNFFFSDSLNSNYSLL